ncbi:hopanoid biosynthesis associated glycosyl transferase protein HpnI [Terriglobus roseus DSM 18391]|uniref:Hopanoid biosynthesis associated glycosyl transferase protein HpnI n=1 Tax=Terriglobus roseus (strain DSM 18391 / NRRL B-41598 / KBS 63) TaxID=926566 RepID=I3ZBC4_TERRK|nr:bacteriohopanetetrol glucosamine biosynthesis glycosyltransferase HpnI [Terriglobus roseus]AFL86542.1 hopanoid biosynthesis associated glycosyl transferase protein HpnI [Terriglobus roseus DSM 18391]
MTAAEIIELITTVLTLAGLAYLLIALLAARAFRREPRSPEPTAWPTVSVLKPIKGMDPRRYAAFASHCTQQYAGRYELLLGLSDPADADVLAEIERLKTEFPTTAIRAIACGERLGTNGKVSTLSQMVPHALGDVILINDADILVGPQYLTRIAADLAQPNVGMVTTPYAGRTSDKPGLWARLEGLGIATDFLPGVLTSRLLDRGVRFGLGSTLALRRTTLEAIGGMTPLLEHLADDYELGARVHAIGMRVVLSPEIVETYVPAYDFEGFWQHQLRWARGVRDARRAGYVGLAITYAIPWALANVIATGFALPSFTLLSLVLLARVALALGVGVGILRDGQVLRDLWLIPLRDCFGLLIWAWSYADDTVVWRGEHFRLKRGILLRP